MPTYQKSHTLLRRLIGCNFSNLNSLEHTPRFGTIQVLEPVLSYTFIFIYLLIEFVLAPLLKIDSPLLAPRDNGLIVFVGTAVGMVWVMRVLGRNVRAYFINKIKPAYVKDRFIKNRDNNWWVGGLLAHQLLPKFTDMYVSVMLAVQVYIFGAILFALQYQSFSSIERLQFLLGFGLIGFAITRSAHIAMNSVALVTFGLLIVFNGFAPRLMSTQIFSIQVWELFIMIFPIALITVASYTQKTKK